MWCQGFNARVGSRESEDQWRMAKGLHGHGSVNDAKKEFSQPTMPQPVTHGFRKKIFT